MSRDSVLLISVCTPTPLTPPRPRAGLGSPASLPQLFGKGIEENESDRKMTERERRKEKAVSKVMGKEGSGAKREGKEEADGGLVAGREGREEEKKEK